MSTSFSERHLFFEGTPNFRDYGGYTTVDGRSVKWRQLFRSGQLAELTDKDLQRFAELQIELVFDFRREDECERDPSLFPAQARPRVINLPIMPGSSGNSIKRVSRDTSTAEDLVGFMCVSYQEFVLDQSEYFRTMFTHILQQQGGASLIHCAAGKDRTGFAVAMMLTALGVPRATIMEDYMLTARYFDIDQEMARIHKKYQWTGDRDNFRPLLEVREMYMHSAFAVIDREFPSTDNYLEQVLGLGPAEQKLLQERYLTESSS